MYEHKQCPYCGKDPRQHLECCPDGNTIAVRLWEAGYQAAIDEKANALAGDSTYTLGYRLGEARREAIEVEDNNLPPRPRHSFPSVSELALTLQESDMPPAPAHSSLPPALDPREAWDREMEARENDNY